MATTANYSLYYPTGNLTVKPTSRDFGMMMNSVDSALAGVAAGAVTAGNGAKATAEAAYSWQTVGDSTRAFQWAKACWEKSGELGIFAMGDSTVEGSGVYVANNRWQNMVAKGLRDMLDPAGSGDTYHTNYLPARYDTFYPMDTAPAKGGTVTNLTGSSGSGLGNRAVSLATGAYLEWTITPDKAATVLVYFNRVATGSGAFSVSVDGVVKNNQSVVGTATSGASVSITGGAAAGTRKIRVTATTGPVIIEGIVVRTATTGVHVYDAAHSGYTFDAYKNEPSAVWNSVTAIPNNPNVGLAVVRLGSNDMAGSENPETMAPKAKDVITTLKSRLPNAGIVVLFASSRCEDARSTYVKRADSADGNWREKQRDYLRELRKTVGDDPRVSVLDEAELWRPLNATPANPSAPVEQDPTGWLADSVHPSATGNKGVAAYLLSLAQEVFTSNASVSYVDNKAANNLAAAKAYTDGTLAVKAQATQLTGTENLNTITTPGSYIKSAGGAATVASNWPAEGFQGWIEVLQPATGSTNYAMQRATGIQSGPGSATVTGAWYRTMYGAGAWRPWTRVEADAILLSGPPSLDTITTSGTYYLNSSTGTTEALGYPVAGFAGTVEVFGNGTSMWMQRATHFSTGAFRNVWWRTKYTTGAWSAWVRLEDGVSVSRTGAGEDLNTITTPGKYLVAASAVNGPVASGTAMLEVLDRSQGDSLIQRYTLTASNALLGAQWTRTRNSSGTWFPWGQTADCCRTGSPEGVISAPVGVYYTDTNATSGARRWYKATGPGATGWKCIDGDTGWRALTVWDATTVTYGSLPAEWAPRQAGGIYIRRIGDTVHLTITGALECKALNTTVSIQTVPDGFRTSLAPLRNVVDRWGVNNNVMSTISLNAATITRGSNSGFSNGDYFFGSAWVFPTNYPWPTTLPGTAV